MADLKEVVALVTNAHDSLGRGVAQGLAEAGATLYLLDATADAVRSNGSVQNTAAEVAELGGKGIPLILDKAYQSIDDGLLELFRRIEAEAGRLDLLVNSPSRTPGATRPSTGFWAEPLTVLDDLCHATLRGNYLTSTLAARLMVEKGRGLILQIAESPAGRVGVIPGTIASAIQRMSEEMAAELAGHGVSALSLVPGPIRGRGGPTAESAGSVTEMDQMRRSPRFVGRCVAALAMDPDILEKSGGHFEIEALQREYRFSDLSERPEEMHE